MKEFRAWCALCISNVRARESIATGYTGRRMPVGRRTSCAFIKFIWTRYKDRHRKPQRVVSGAPSIRLQCPLVSVVEGSFDPLSGGCVGQDLNLRTPTGQDPEPCAFDQAWQPTHAAARGDFVAS